MYRNKAVNGQKIGTKSHGRHTSVGGKGHHYEIMLHTCIMVSWGDILYTGPATGCGFTVTIVFTTVPILCACYMYSIIITIDYIYIIYVITLQCPTLHVTLYTVMYIARLRYGQTVQCSHLIINCTPTQLALWVWYMRGFHAMNIINSSSPVLELPCSIDD